MTGRSSKNSTEAETREPTILENVLGLAPEGSVPAISTPKLPGTREVDIAVDSEENDIYAYAQSNIKSVTEDAVKAVSRLVEICDQTESARIFEVMATMIKTVVDASSQMIELEQKKKKTDHLISKDAKKVMPVAGEAAPTNVTNHNTFNFTPDKLNDLVATMKAEMKLANDMKVIDHDNEA